MLEQVADWSYWAGERLDSSRARHSDAIPIWPSNPFDIEGKQQGNKPAPSISQPEYRANEIMIEQRIDDTQINHIPSPDDCSSTATHAQNRIELLEDSRVRHSEAPFGTQEFHRNQFNFIGKTQEIEKNPAFQREQVSGE
jgi:hypothetical protein